MSSPDNKGKSIFMYEAIATRSAKRMEILRIKRKNWYSQKQKHLKFKKILKQIKAYSLSEKDMKVKETLSKTIRNISSVIYVKKQGDRQCLEYSYKKQKKKFK